MYNCDNTLTFDIQVYKDRNKENIIRDKIICTNSRSKSRKSTTPLSPFSLLNKLPRSKKKKKLLITKLFEGGTYPRIDRFLKPIKATQYKRLIKITQVLYLYQKCWMFKNKTQ